MTGPSPFEAWFIRAMYVGTIIGTPFCMVLVGLGAHVYKWEIYLWGVVLLGWVFAWSYQVSATLSWRAACQAAEGDKSVPRVILLEDKPQDVQGERNDTANRAINNPN